MSDHLVNTARPSTIPQLPLLFFTKNRRRGAMLAAIWFLVLLVPIVYFARASWQLAAAKWWGGFAVCASVVLFISYCVIRMVIGTFQTLKPGPVLIIYEQGIHDRRLGKRIIPWDEITIIWQKIFLLGQLMVCFELARTSEFRRNMSPLQRLSCLFNRLSGLGSFYIDFSYLDVDAEAAIAGIFELIKAANPQVRIAPTDRGPLKR